MANASFFAEPVLKPDPATGHLVIRESCGLDHARQILTVACPADVPQEVQVFSFRNLKTGVELPAQRSQQNPELAFVQIELRSSEEYQLVAQDHSPDVLHATTLSRNDGQNIVSNGKWSAEIFLGEWLAEKNGAPSFHAPTPFRRLRVKNGFWRGSFFFDVRQPVQHITSTVIEPGPLRIVTLFQARIGVEHSYSARLTFDADADYIGVDEDFEGDSSDQLVWDFSGEDLPEQIHLLDSTAGFTTQPLHYFFDRRLARLACWNQYSQLHDFSDGYALTFAQNDDVIGCVALKGGDWNGNSHNFLEAWARRWFPGDPTSRRIPPEAKADAAPSLEKISGRPVNLCEPHFSLEGWLHRGRRIFALVLASRDSLRPADWNAAPPLGHFESESDRPRYRQQQSLLRRIHTQHGMFPLADQLKLCWSWPQEKAPVKPIDASPPWERDDEPLSTDGQLLSTPQRVEQMLEFLAARVFGFWEGSGSAYTNAVVSRRLAHDLIDWEWLADKGHFTQEQYRQGRAWFVFLCHLFSSDHYYPGAASMNLGDPGKRLEPTMAGMANQNFFTDIFNMPGMAAQIFHSHPDAIAWRQRFTQMWPRQLEYHVYPQSGVWEESHTYFHHVLQTVLPTLERRHEDGVENSFVEPTFQRLVASLLKMLTPRDDCFGGKRHPVALGDHGVDLKDIYRPLYRRLAHLISESNPDLASQLGWAYLEMGGDRSLSIESKSMTWQNEYVQGLGYFFRTQDDRGESLMVLRCGNAWAHHHNDEGSLQYIYAGRSWIVDSAFSYPQETAPRKFRADGHSRWAPRDLDPLNYLWQFNRGWITRHQGDGPFPYAVAFTPIYMAETSVQQYIPLRCPILHWRCVVQLAPSAFLILDRSNTSIPQETHFHVPTDAPVLIDNAGPVPLDKGPYLRIHPLLGLMPVHIKATDRPTQADERFATREICYAWKECALTALLVMVETADLAPTLSVQYADDCISIHHSGLSAQLDFSTPEKINLLHSQTGHRSTISLADTSQTK